MNIGSSPAPRNVVARKINRERVVLLGWGRAILLQLAHPLVAQGVSDHSLFGQQADRYLQRAVRTVRAMLAMTFAREAEARAVADRINAIHVRVEGTLRRSAGIYSAGTPYSARDPHLLQWVHATLVDSLPLAYEHFVGPLTEGEKDQYCAEAGAASSLLGLPVNVAPGNATELAAYMRGMLASGELEVTEMARSLADALLSPRLGPAAPVFRLARLATIGLLPPRIREGYGFTWDQRQERAFHRLSTSVRRAHALLPARVREWRAARLAVDD